MATVQRLYLCLLFGLIVATEAGAKRRTLFYHNPSTKAFIHFAPSSAKPVLTASIGITLPPATSIITKAIEQDLYQLTFESNDDHVTTKLAIETTHSEGDIQCRSVEWSNDQGKELIDCFDLTGSHWYGGAEMKDQQFWPINKQVVDSFKPYVTGLYDSAGSVIERYWLSSAGVAIVVDPRTPLFVLKNATSLCFKANSTEWPYSGRFPGDFKYSICHIERSSSPADYLNRLHLFIVNNFLAKPTGIPDKLMFQRPIWSTWAAYKANIDVNKVMEFAHEIVANNFSNSQLEIDDKWQTFYGDFNFQTSKFPSIADTVRELNAMGFRTTLWVHPFADLISENFFVQSYNLYAVCNAERLRPLVTTWWDSLLSVILDTTNVRATDWFVANLEGVRQKALIDSFKFDAGEVNWLPRSFVLLNATDSPNEYSERYARMAARLGPMIEVRVGSQTQDLPVFVRMLDKDSTWGFDNGLKSVLTTALTFSVLGYPYILPDMIGGNAYYIGNDNKTKLQGVYPDAQLYIRWTQLTTFLPSMQFSIPPWFYKDPTLTKICRDLVQLHEDLVFPELMTASNKTITTGEPLIKPIWWADNDDELLLQIDDQFMVGDGIMVAPILAKDTFKRDIYLPKGTWIADDQTVMQGPQMLVGVDVPISRIPYFIRRDN